MRLTYTPAAQADLNDIYEYTFDNWGIEQAESYILDIHATCGALAKGLKKGRDASDIRDGYRKQNTGSHVAFYKHTDDGLVIIRILHNSRDFERHL